MSTRCERCGARSSAPTTFCSRCGAQRPAGDPLIGAVLAGRYRVIERIGSGSFANVYRGRHDGVGRDVAIKALAPQHARSPVTRERFLREARAANRVNHDNVIDVTDVGVTDRGLPFLVMEMLGGETLRSELGTAWPDARVEWLGSEVGRALAAAHALGVVHRDLKPENIMLTGSRLTVLDFGLAKMAGERRLTRSSTFLGTPAYTSPEQIRADTVTPATDVYALGCILFEALTGRAPFLGDPPGVMAAHLGEPPPSLPGHVPASIAFTVQAALAKDPADRPSVAEVVQTLSGAPFEAPPPSAPPTREDRVRERHGLLGRLIAHLHPDGDAPPSITAALDEVETALVSTPDDAGSSENERSSKQVELEAAILGSAVVTVSRLDTESAEALVAMGRLAERWLSNERAARGRAAPQSTSPDDRWASAEAVLDAIEAYLDAHPEGAHLLP